MGCGSSTPASEITETKPAPAPAPAPAAAPPAEEAVPAASEAEPGYPAVAELFSQAAAVKESQPGNRCVTGTPPPFSPY